MTHNKLVVGSCSFPMVNTTTNAIIVGTVLVYAPKPPTERLAVSWVSFAERDDLNTGAIFYNKALFGDGHGVDKPLAIQAAANAAPPAKGDVFVDVLVPGNKEFSGASAGLAVFLALTFGHTQVVATGFLLEDGNGLPSELRVMPIDNVDAKARGEYGEQPLVIPFGNVEKLLEGGFPRGKIFCMEDYIRSRGAPLNLTSGMVVAPGTIGDLIVLLGAKLRKQCQKRKR